MKDNVGGRGARRQGAILGAVLLALASGFCVLPGGHGMADHQSMAPDLCVLMLAVALIVTLIPGPLLSGWARSDRPSRLLLAPLHASDPPPKSVRLS